MEIKCNKYRINQTIFILLLSILFIFIGFACFFASKEFNPDRDSYWLIETGRWILENKSVPKINPWTYTDNLNIIIQSPICAIFNYLWYLNFNELGNMWQLAIIENIILLISTIYLSYQFCKNKNISILSAIIIEYLFISCGLITTRPYQLTTASMMFLIANLEKAKRKNNMKLVFLAVAFSTLFQANFQMASLFMIPCFIICYAFGNILDSAIKDNIFPSFKDIFIWIFIFIEWGLLSLVNPYGIDGFLYLINSSDAMSIVGSQIIEMKPPTTMSTPFFTFIIIIFMFFYRAIKRKKWQMSEAFLIFGSIIASFLAIRNFWMEAIAFIVIFSLFLNDLTEKIENIIINKLKILPLFCHILFRLLCIFISIFCFYNMFSQSIHFGNETSKELNKIISCIDDFPEDSKIYTSFNTGGLIEFCKRKIYVDARPELYSPNITKNDIDILKEWHSIEWKNSDNLIQYINSSNWDYYFVSEGSPIDYYFKYSGDGELIFKNKIGIMYRLKKT